MTDINVLHWTTLSGERTRTKLHPKMLSERGYAIKRSIGNRRLGQMAREYVLFDRSYVLEVLAKHFDLLAIDQDEALELTNEAYQYLESLREAQNAESKV